MHVRCGPGEKLEIISKVYLSVSHAAAYTIVSYQTAWLKQYYPVEFMAALITSVIDNTTKVAEYIMACRQMGIELLPPDINSGESGFSVENGNIRYGLSAIKSLGKPVIDAIVNERAIRGPYKTFRDFVERLSGKEVNKRTIESFIKAGVFDGFEQTRKQLMMVYVQVLDQVNQEKKNSMTGKLSLFDFVDEDVKKEFEVKYPDVGEYDKETLLAFEKEVLGVYISGHPLDEFAEIMKKNITALSLDFNIDKETGVSKLRDNQRVIIGGMIAQKTVKTTKTNQMMAFIQIEDLTGTVEVIIFPRDYDKYRELLVEDKKVYIKGRVSASEDQQEKLVCENVIAFEEIPKEVWIKFDSIEAFQGQEKTLYQMIRDEDGEDGIIIYCMKEKQMKRLPAIHNISANSAIIEKLQETFGSENVKVTQSNLKTS